ncbi:MAG: hypothetical protein WC858_06295 [Parcubacteria group bacterium]|jgi:hypothetical protein
MIDVREVLNSLQPLKIAFMPSDVAEHLKALGATKALYIAKSGAYFFQRIVDDRQLTYYSAGGIENDAELIDDGD